MISGRALTQIRFLGWIVNALLGCNAMHDSRTLFSWTILSIRPARLLLCQLLDFGYDRCTGVRTRSKLQTRPTLTLGIQALEGNLLVQATTALFVCSHVPILGGQPTFEQPSTILGTELEATKHQPVAS